LLRRVGIDSVKPSRESEFSSDEIDARRALDWKSKDGSENHAKELIEFQFANTTEPSMTSPSATTSTPMRLAYFHFPTPGNPGGGTFESGPKEFGQRHTGPPYDSFPSCCRR